MYQMQGIIKISVEVPFNQKKVVVHNKPKVSNLTKQTQPENCIKASAENNNPSSLRKLQNINLKKQGCH